MRGCGTLESVDCKLCVIDHFRPELFFGEHQRAKLFRSNPAGFQCQVQQAFPDGWDLERFQDLPVELFDDGCRGFPAIALEFFQSVLERSFSRLLYYLTDSPANYCPRLMRLCLM